MIIQVCLFCIKIFLTIILNWNNLDQSDNDLTLSKPNNIIIDSIKINEYACTNPSETVLKETSKEEDKDNSDNSDNLNNSNITINVDLPEAMIDSASSTTGTETAINNKPLNKNSLQNSSASIVSNLTSHSNEKTEHFHQNLNKFIEVKFFFAV